MSKKYKDHEIIEFAIEPLDSVAVLSDMCYSLENHVIRKEEIRPVRVGMASCAVKLFFDSEASYGNWIFKSAAEKIPYYLPNALEEKVAQYLRESRVGFDFYFFRERLRWRTQFDLLRGATANDPEKGFPYNATITKLVSEPESDKWSVIVGFKILIWAVFSGTAPR